jgi:general nucleoside transport system permease protein
MSDALRKVAAPVVALAGALALSSLIMFAFHASPLRALEALFQGAFGSEQGVAETLVQTTALLFAGLGVAIAFRAGLFNIGAEGQLTIGGLCTALAGASLHLPAALEIPLCLLAGAAGGAIWGGIAGFLRARFGASEVITTIMLNYVAFLGAGYLVSGPLRGDANAPETAPIATTAMLSPLIANTRLTVALPLALALAFALAWWLRRSVAGYELRAVGSAERAARYAGVDAKRVIIQAMSMSGALAGLAGATQVLGLLHRFNAGLSPGYGFTSIAVALLGGSDPIGVIFSAFFFGALQNGALAMQSLAGVPKDLVSVVEGLIILFMAARRFSSGRLFLRRPAAMADTP